jgi:DUF1680 family protein
METCVTQTWMKLCMNLLRLTGKPLYADHVERSAYNALAAAMQPGGASFAKYTPLEGSRSLGEGQCGMDINCCTANGPRAMMLLPAFALMQNTNQVYVNLYGPLKTTFPINGRNRVTLEVSTDYPVADSVSILVQPQKAENFTLALRIPAWSEKTTIQVNGRPVASPPAGGYARISRRWQAGDRLLLRLDLRGRLVTVATTQPLPADGGAGPRQPLQ